MFQAWLVKMRITLASSRPIFECGNNATSVRVTAGRNERMGTLCKISSSGIMTRSARRLLAAICP
jgi:hypothetical protein